MRLASAPLARQAVAALALALSCATASAEVRMLFVDGADSVRLAFECAGTAAAGCGPAGVEWLPSTEADALGRVHGSGVVVSNVTSHSLDALFLVPLGRPANVGRFNFRDRSTGALLKTLAIDTTDGAASTTVMLAYAADEGQGLAPLSGATELYADTPYTYSGQFTGIDMLPLIDEQLFVALQVVDEPPTLALLAVLAALAGVGRKSSAGR